jgi:hypothetical protein
MTDDDGRDMRDLLGTALRGEPPSTVDAARLMRLGKRRLALQRAGAALGVMVLAGGIALGASLLHHGSNGARPDPISAAGTSRTATPPSIPVTPPVTSGPFSASVTPNTLPSTLPNALDIVAAQNQALNSVYAPPAGMVTTGGSLTFIAGLPLSRGYGGSFLSTKLTDHNGSGRLGLSVVVTNTGPSAMTCGGSKMTCTMRLVNGITVEIETDHPTATTTRILTVASNAAGNVLVDGEVDNIASTSKTATRPSPPLTADQLAKITAAVASATP